MNKGNEQGVKRALNLPSFGVTGDIFLRETLYF